MVPLIAPAVVCHSYKRNKDSHLDEILRRLIFLWDPILEIKTLFGCLRITRRIKVTKVWCAMALFVDKLGPESLG